MDYGTTQEILLSFDKDRLLASASSGFPRLIYVVQTKTVFRGELVFVDVVIYGTYRSVGNLGRVGHTNHPLCMTVV